MNIKRWKNRYIAKWILCFSLTLVVFPWAVSNSSARDDSPGKEIAVSDEVSAGLTHMRNLLSQDQGRSMEPDLAVISPVIDFVTRPNKEPSALYHSDANYDGRSAYLEYEIGQNLQNILDYVYVPSIPANALVPSSVRLAYYHSFNGKAKPQNWRWDLESVNDSPLVVRAAEHEETTPDVFSGSYYSYDLHRVLILLNYQGKKTFISISGQKDVSEVGKKAYTVGSDKNWCYLYTHEEGVNKFGLGWVKPYMYSSYTLMVFQEQQPGLAPVKCGIFKWLNAGWAGINMVNRNHIYSGLKRHEQALKTVIEDPKLPKPRVIIDALAKIDKLPMSVLKQEIQRYLDLLKKRHSDAEVFQNQELAEFFSGQEYIQQLDKREMQAILEVEYMKSVLERDPIIELSALGLPSEEYVSRR